MDVSELLYRNTCHDYILGKLTASYSWMKKTQVQAIWELSILVA